LVGTNGLAANGTTLNAGDVLDGKGGTADKLTVSISGTNTGPVVTSAVTMTNVEEISVVNYQTDDTNDNTINLAGVSGVTKLTLAASADTGDTAFTNVRGLAAAEMGNGAGDLSITYLDSVVVGEADTQVLTLAGQTDGEFTVDAVVGGIESLTITSGTVANKVKVTSDTAKAITVTGDQKLTLTEGMVGTLTSVDASALTGQFLFTHDEATDISIKGGAANDTITFSSADFTSADTVDGGGGDDTLSIANTVAMAATDLAKVSSVEKITLTGAGAALTLASNVSATEFSLAAAGAQTLTLSSESARVSWRLVGLS